MMSHNVGNYEPHGNSNHEPVFKQEGSEVEPQILEGESSNSQEKGQTGFDNDFVGRIAEKNLLNSYLVDLDESKKKIRVVSIYGKGGVGKTTLAAKVYRQVLVGHHFQNFAWVSVTKQCQTRKFFQDILKQLILGKEEEIMSFEDTKLVEELYRVQKEKKCLVVLDNIYSIDAWESLKIAFPIEDQTTQSKILFTTSSIKVKEDIEEERKKAAKEFVHELGALDENESWELFNKNGGLGMQMDEYFDSIAREMVKECAGLPLAISLLRGLLKGWKREDWAFRLKEIKSCRRGIDFPDDLMNPKILSLSYEYLSPDLKPCFDYMGYFREDSETETEKLFQLWLAEKILDEHRKEGQETMMDVAKCSLDELVARSLIQSKEDEESNVGYARCSLSSDVQKLCHSKVASSSSSAQEIHRLGMFFDAETRNVGPSISEIAKLDKFNKLSVLDFEGLDFQAKERPTGIGKLKLLRYLSFKKCCLKELPKSIKKLDLLEILDLRVDGSVLVPNVLRKNKKLRYLYLPCEFSIKRGTNFFRDKAKQKLQLDGLINLEILECFNTSMCDVNDLYKLINLRKLGATVDGRDKDATVEGTDKDLQNIISFVESKSQCLSLNLNIRGWDCHSEKRLKLFENISKCESLRSLMMQGRIDRIPEVFSGRQWLIEIRLEETQIEEDPMKTLEKLPNLRTLHLIRDILFKVDKIVCSAEGFPQLCVLHLQEIRNLKRWEVAGGMQKLTYLGIHACKNLDNVPDGLRSINTLRKLKITSMPESFVNKIRIKDGIEGEDFDKVRHVPFITIANV